MAATIDVAMSGRRLAIEPLRIFISHASPDEAFALRLARDLTSAGADAWLDTSHVGPGDFVARISQALNSRDVLVLVLSPAALRSSWVTAEVNAGIVRYHQGFMQAPVFVVAEPVALREIPALWTTYNRIDAGLDYATALPRILQSLRLTATVQDAPAAVLPPAAAAEPVAPAGTSVNLPTETPLVAAPQDAPAAAVPLAITLAAKPTMEPDLRQRPRRMRPAWVLGALAALLLVISVGVLVADRVAAAAAASGARARETADSRSTQTSVSGMITAVDETATAQQIANVTATAQATVHYPYKAMAPGPNCDQGKAPWTPVVPPSSIKCFPTYTQITTNTSIQWSGQPPDTLPSTFTVSVEVTYLSQNQAATLSVFESDGENGTLTLGNDGTVLEGWCRQTSGCQSNGTGINSGTHTLAIIVQGSSVTMLVDNSPFFHATAAKGASVESIDLGDGWYTIYHVQGYGDFTKFEIT